MIFLISMILTAAIVVGGKAFLKKHAVACYLAATAAAVAVVVCTWTGAFAQLPGWMQTWVWPIFARGALSTALFVAVMYAGALPYGSKGMKAIMPVRGELSIIASLLTLGHNIAYGKTYFVLLFTRPDRLSVTQLAAAFCSLVMLCVMLPLFITSFKCIRKRMKGSTWKRLQRTAYVFYALIYAHVLLLTVPRACQGDVGYLLTVLVYSIVFLTYGAMRVQKSLKNYPLRVRNAPLITAVLALLLVTYGTAAPFLQASRANVGGNTRDAGQQAETAGMETAVPAAETEETLESSGVDAVEPGDAENTNPAADRPVVAERDNTDIVIVDGTAGTVPTETPTTPSAANPTPSGAAQVPTTPPPPAAPEGRQQPAAPAEKEKPTADPITSEPETPALPVEPAVVLQYKNGTFTGSGEGFGGAITVSVSIENDKITGISVVASSDDEPYWSDGKTVINRILSAQSPNVDTVSGATFSSGGIIEAVKAALRSAKN